MSTTGGTGATTLGAAFAVLIRLGVGSAITDTPSLRALGPRLRHVGSRRSRLSAHSLGPDENEQAQRETARQVLAGLIAGRQACAFPQAGVLPS